ncbi:MAG: hypothetical protein E7600_03025 [Ruminococcaceae bacterium]|nr:hypothetical protein [Oscillospiraceae bacterium]
MKKCSKCGFEVNDNDSFCQNCGFTFASNNQETQTPQVTPVSIDNCQKKNGAKKIIIIAAIVTSIILAISAVCGIFIYRILNRDDVSAVAKPKVYKFGALSMNEIYFASGEESEVLFTVKVEEGDPEELFLYEGKKKIAKMNDDGVDGDEKANDKIYSCKAVISMKANKYSTVEYHCGVEDSESVSEPVEAHVFPQLNETAVMEAYQIQNSLKTDISAIESNYYNDNGFVDEANYKALIADIQALLDTYVKEGKVLHYTAEGDSVFVKFTSGLGSLYAPRKEGYDNVGKDVSMSILTCQPCFTDMGGENFPADGQLPYALPSDVEYLLEILDQSGDNVEVNFPNYDFDDDYNYDDSEVTLELIKSFGSNQVILWHGHGYYGPVVKSCLVTGEAFDFNAWLWDADYFIDCVSNRIINSLIVGYDNAIISSGFIEHYCGDMTNSMVYLAACDSGRTDELTSAFTNKGAAVVANTDTILRTYNVAMLYGTLANLQKIDFETNEYYTLSEALEAAKSVYGESDASYGGSGATPEIFGGATAENYRLSDEIWYGSLSGKVSEASDIEVSVSGALIEAYIGDDLYASTVSDSDGQYILELPQSDYRIDISADGYIDFSAFTSIAVNETKYMETFLLVEGDKSQSGYASGTIYNSLSGSGCSDVYIIFRENWNNTDEYAEGIGYTYTDSEGNYSVELPYGNYTAVLSKNGYSVSYKNIVVHGGVTSNQNGMITPEISGDNYLITLTWGYNPSDLDSHLEGTDINGNYFHVYYGNKQYSNYEEVCNLDYDDTTSYGPEHVTLNAQGDEPYYYYVYRYSGSGTVASSGAKVTVEQGNVLVAEFYVPTNLGSGDYWNVFAIKDGELIVQNTISDYAETNYAE